MFASWCDKCRAWRYDAICPKCGEITRFTAMDAKEVKKIRHGVTHTTNDPTVIERAKREAEWRLRREKLWGRK